MQQAGTSASLPLLIDTTTVFMCLWMRSVPPPGVLLQPLSSRQGREGNRAAVFILAVRCRYGHLLLLLPSCLLLLLSVYLWITPACCSPAAVLSSCWTSISLGDALWSNCENGIFSHKEAFIAELLHSSIFCAVNGDGCEWKAFTTADFPH